MLTQITDYALLAFVVTAVWSPLLINILYRFNIVVQHRLMRNKMNEEFFKIHGHKSGTPTLGGLMISVTVGILALVAVPQSSLRDVFLIGWTVFTIYGLVEGILVYGRKLSDGLRIMQESFEWRLGKLLVLFLMSLSVIWMVSSMLGMTSIVILPGFELPINALTGGLGALAMIVAIYGIEITDGADGLVTGQFLVALAAYLVIILLTNSQALIPFAAMILGSTLVYLYFNINPARVFMGGTGTFPIAFALLLFSIVTGTVGIFLVLGLIFWVEIASSAFQIISIRFFKRKLFKIAPIHHYFEAIGWPETKMVQRFWLVSAVNAMVALWLFAHLYL